MDLVKNTNSPFKSKSDLTQTAYQTYINFNNKNIIDFTEQKLKRYSMQCGSLESQKILILLSDYLTNRVAICWKHGKPLYILINNSNHNH